MEPEPQEAVTVGYVAAPGPLLCTSLLADTTADGVDAGVLAFLTRAALEAQEEEARRVQLAQAKAERKEQRVRRQEMVDELAELLRASLPSERTPSVERRISELRSSIEASSSSMPSMRRKRKKRRKKRLPRRHGCRRPGVHQRQVPAVRFSPLLALGTPVVTQRQVPTAHSFILPVQLLDKVLDMPVVVLRQVPGLMVQKLWSPRSCSSSSVVDILFVPQRQIPMVQSVQQTTEIPQLPFVFKWSMTLLCWSCGSTGCSSPYTAH